MALGLWTWSLSVSSSFPSSICQAGKHYFALWQQPALVFLNSGCTIELSVALYKNPGVQALPETRLKTPDPRLEG